MYAPLIKLVGRAIYSNKTATKVFETFVIALLGLLTIGIRRGAVYSYLLSIDMIEGPALFISAITVSFLILIGCYIFYYHKNTASKTENKNNKQETSSNAYQTICNKLTKLYLNKERIHSVSLNTEIVNIIMNNKNLLQIKDSYIEKVEYMLVLQYKSSFELKVQQEKGNKTESLESIIELFKLFTQQLFKGILLDGHLIMQNSTKKKMKSRTSLDFEECKEFIGVDTGCILNMYLMSQIDLIRLEASQLKPNKREEQNHSSDNKSDKELFLSDIRKIWSSLSEDGFKDISECKKLVELILNTKEDIGIEDSHIEVVNKQIEFEFADKLNLIPKFRESLCKGELIDYYGYTSHLYGITVDRLNKGKLKTKDLEADNVTQSLRLEASKGRKQTIGANKGNILAMYLDAKFYYLTLSGYDYTQNESYKKIMEGRTAIAVVIIIIIILVNYSDELKTLITLLT